MEKSVDLLIIGAGPFGLAMAAYAQHLGIDYAIVGKPMEFWKAHMPEGTYLRSATHLDPMNWHTIEAFLETQGLTHADVEPPSLRFYLNYAQWFQEQKRLQALPVLIRRLCHVGDEDRFQATLDNGRIIRAKHVVIAVGFKPFKHLPPELVERLPLGRFSHACDQVNFQELAGKRCLIIGGRQSALEWAALLHEAGVAAVHVAYRHASPVFQASDLSWIGPLMEAIADDPGWFRRLSQEEQEIVNHRMWAEGRLKVEPWLEPRVTKETIHRWPRTQVVACDKRSDGELAVQLDKGPTLTVDHIILATGYTVKMGRVAFLAQGNILDSLATRNGFPVLDEQFQTSVPGLFITGLPATQDFGPFFGFMNSARLSARVIGHALVNRNRQKGTPGRHQEYCSRSAHAPHDGSPA
jgi:thioredoxin reductase